MTKQDKILWKKIKGIIQKSYYDIDLNKYLGYESGEHLLLVARIIDTFDALANSESETKCYSSIERKYLASLAENLSLSKIVKLFEKCVLYSIYIGGANHIIDVPALINCLCILKNHTASEEGVSIICNGINALSRYASLKYPDMLDKIKDIIRREDPLPEKVIKYVPDIGGVLTLQKNLLHNSRSSVIRDGEVLSVLNYFNNLCHSKLVGKGFPISRVYRITLYRDNNYICSIYNMRDSGFSKYLEFSDTKISSGEIVRTNLSGVQANALLNVCLGIISKIRNSELFGHVQEIYFRVGGADCMVIKEVEEEDGSISILFV